MHDGGDKIEVINRVDDILIEILSSIITNCTFIYVIASVLF